MRFSYATMGDMWDEFPEPPTPSECGSRKARAKAKAAGRSTKVNKSCFCADCEYDKKINSRFRLKHHKPFEGMRYQAEAQNELSSFEEVMHRYPPTTLIHPPKANFPGTPQKPS